MSGWSNRIVGHGTENPEQLLANPENWRIHPDDQRIAMRAILREIGWIQSIVINRTTGHMIDGHLRAEEAIREGAIEVPVVYVELSHEEERKALAAFDSITALAVTDQATLNDIITSTQAQDAEMAEFLRSLLADVDEEEEKPDEDEPPAPQEVAISQPGDIWILGDHRLMVGDTTKQADIDALMDGAQADLVWTDPPYNVDYQGSDGKKIQNDKMADSAFFQFLTDSFRTMVAATKPGGPIYIAHADSEGLNFRRAMETAGWLHKQTLIWVKNSFTLGRQDYQWQHEPILYG